VIVQDGLLEVEDGRLVKLEDGDVLGQANRNARLSSPAPTTTTCRHPAATASSSCWSQKGVRVQK
jgi:hypothetical protein